MDYREKERKIGHIWKLTNVFFKLPLNGGFWAMTSKDL